MSSTLTSWVALVSDRSSGAAQAAMKAAGQLLSRPTAYRAAVSTADFALGHLPRFVLYNGLNVWGKQREVPAPPKQTFHSWYRANRGKKA